MLTRILYGILISIVCAAIGRGIVAAFGLDVRVARMIQGARELPNLSTIAWAISGLFGLVCLLCWQIFHVSEKLEGLMPGERPALGSLTQTNFIVEVTKSHSTGRVDVRMSVELTNTNDYLIKYKAAVIGEVGDKKGSASSFEAFIPAHQSRFLLYDMGDVPTGSGLPGHPFLIGSVHYDVTYFSASSQKATRRTARRNSFSTSAGAQDMPPGSFLEQRTGIQVSEEIEE